VIIVKKGFGKKNLDSLTKLENKFGIDNYMLEDDERRGLSSMGNFLHFFDRYEIEDELHIDEKVLLQTNAMSSRYSTIKVLSLLFFLGFFSAFWYSLFKALDGNTAHKIYAIVYFSVSLFLFISLMKIKRRKKYAITNKRVIILDNVESKSIKLERIVETKAVSNDMPVYGSILFMLVDSNLYSEMAKEIHDIKDYVYANAVLNDAILKRRIELGVEAPADDKIQKNPFNILSPDEINSKFDSMLEHDEKIVYSDQEVFKYELRKASDGGDTSTLMIIIGTASLFTIILFFVKWYYALFPLSILLLILSGFIFKDKQRLSRVYTDTCFAITNKRIMFAHDNYKKAFAYRDIEFLPLVRCEYDCGYIHFGTLASRCNGRLTEVYKIYVDKPDTIHAIINKAKFS